MAAIGHVSLDSKEYRLRNPPVQTLANQMAPRIASGESEYSSLDLWSAWIQEDWTAGIGNLNPNRSQGVLYGESETRVPSQMILPPLLRQYDLRTKNATTADCRYMPEDMAGTITVGAGGYAKVAFQFHTSTTPGFDKPVFWLYASIGAINISFNIYTDVSNAPGVLAENGYYDSQQAGKGYYWHGFHIAIEISALAANTDYWAVIEPDTPTDTFTIGYGSTGYNKAMMQWTGSAWSSVTGKYLMYSSEYFRLGGGALGCGFFRFNNKLYCYSSGAVHDLDTVNMDWESTGTLVDQSAITSAVTWNDKVYFGNGGVTTTDYNTMSTAEAFTSTGVNGSLFAKHAGYLWRAYLNQVWYSSDGTTWVGPFDVGDPGYEITGMAGLGQNMYFANAEGLFYLAPGDFVVGVAPWGSDDPENGRRMIAYQGALYITVGGRVMRFTEDGSLQDVWVSREDDLVENRIGKVWDMCIMNNWLVVIVSAGSSLVLLPTMWAMSGSNWHHIATLPFVGGNQVVDNYSDYAVYYDRVTQKLWAITPNQTPFAIYVPDYTLNPYNDPFYTYMPSAWVEWDWFYGPVRENDKDMDSVTLMGENLSANQYISVYWKDDGSTDWELLGTATTDTKELRWPITTRPDTKRLKLGFLLRTTDGSETPRLRAFRLKYMTMVKDWFRWNLNIDVSGGLNGRSYQEMLNGERNTYSASQIKANLDALAKSTPPFIYTDVDGLIYLVKAQAATFNYDKVLYNSGMSNKEWEGTYSITIEQVTSGTYTAP